MTSGIVADILIISPLERSCHLWQSFYIFASTFIFLRLPFLTKDKKIRHWFRKPCLSNIISALFPFRYPMKLDTLIFGGILKSRCTWSGIIFPSSISTPLYLHSILMISCKSALYCPYIAFLLYFGMNTM